MVIPEGDKPTKSEGANVVHHRIELCSFTKSVPVNVAELLREIGGVLPVKSDGKSVYYSSPYANEKEANKDIKRFQKMGFSEAKQVVQYNGQFISLDEYHRINTSGSDVRVWK